MLAPALAGENGSDESVPTAIDDMMPYMTEQQLRLAKGNSVPRWPKPEAIVHVMDLVSSGLEQELTGGRR